MKKQILSIISMAILSVSVMLAGIGSTENTARASFSKALSVAKSWQGDAVLTHISAPSINEDGTAKEWIHNFYSPKTKNWYYVTAQGEKIEGTEIGFGKTDALSDKFIDSDKAMETAKTHGLKGKTPSMSLAIYRFKGNSTGYWMVSGGYEKGDVTIFLEANTGKFYSKNVIE